MSTQSYEPNMIAMRPDGRYEVATTDEANRLYGCRRDDWCILKDGHDGNCNEQRDVLR